MAMPSSELDQGAFAARYAELDDGELLRLASDRNSLGTAAAAALDTELSKRNLSTTQPPEDEPEAVLAEPLEHPYRWGKFVGGLTLISSVVALGLTLVEFDLLGVALSAVYGIYGFGIYEKRKWAVLLLEAGSCTGVVAAVIVLLRSGTLAPLGDTLLLLLFWAPQLLYFWKRRHELR